MHGLVFREFQKFYVNHFGHTEWINLTKVLHLDENHFEINESYSDKSFMKLALGTIKKHNLNPRQTLEDFGKFMVPFLLRIYEPKPEWKTLDLLEHTEHEIHKTVRMRNKEASPPRLTIFRWDHDEVEIRYKSSRNIPFLAVGIIKGLANHYNEQDLINIRIRKLRGKSYSIRVIQKQVPDYAQYDTRLTKVN